MYPGRLERYFFYGTRFNHNKTQMLVSYKKKVNSNKI